mmetsp:Transcript_15655/g.28086  ORF Transcript_15655/g.28086 Transcript_15655/m.28086 type:complete len:216 (-) Transcript_15655:3-650(-)
MKAFSVLARSSSALARAPPIPLALGVRTTSAPRARRTMRRSMDIDSGIVRISLYPRAAAMKAKAIPVFPEVGSTSTVCPGVIFPAFSASRIIERPIRSLTELIGSMLSSFAYTFAPAPSAPGIVFSFTRGVFPMSSVTSPAVGDIIVAADLTSVAGLRRLEHGFCIIEVAKLDRAAVIPLPRGAEGCLMQSMTSAKAAKKARSCGARIFQLIFGT